MTSNRKIAQITLSFIGLFLILATYFLYPKILQKNIVSDQADKGSEIKTDDSESSTFEDVKYTGLYDVDKSFTVESEKAYILNTDPDVVYMNLMIVNLYMDDGRVVVITSDKGNYNKITYDCFFEYNVKAEDGETVITSENLELWSSKDFAKIYNNVLITNESGILKADQVNYDFKTRRYDVSMFNNERVKVKVIE